MKILNLALIACITCIFISCSNEDRVKITIEGAENFQKAKELYERERAAWEELNIKNYQFTRTQLSDADWYEDPITINIEEGKSPEIVDFWLLPSYYTDYPENIHFKSISELFDCIKSDLDSIKSIENGTYDGYKTKSVYLKIKYDPQYHYPIEYSWGIGPVLGGWYNFKVTEFIPR